MICYNQNLILEKLLKKDNCFTVYHFNIHSLATEMFKVTNNRAMGIIDDLLTRYYHNLKMCPKSFFLFQVHCSFVHNSQNSVQYYSFLI